MPDKKVEAQVLEDIGTLKEKLGVSNAVYDGLQAANHWKPGKHVSMADFKKAYADFLKSPIDGRKIEVKK